MHLFATLEDFNAQLGTITKWRRCLEALNTVQSLPRNTAHSIGDSLTYWWDKNAQLATTAFVGHRRYLDVWAPIQGNMTVELAPKHRLQAIDVYDDLSDRERFTGSGAVVAVPLGGLIVIDDDEASRIIANPDGTGALIRVTVEGYTFPNK